MLAKSIGTLKRQSPERQSARLRIANLTFIQISFDINIRYVRKVTLVIILHDMIYNNF